MLDMVRYIFLYRVLFELLRGIVVILFFVFFLLFLEKDNGLDIVIFVGVLFDKMRVCVDIYVSRLRYVYKYFLVL